jgi:hypothetical protein
MALNGGNEYADGPSSVSNASTNCRSLFSTSNQRMAGAT